MASVRLRTVEITSDSRGPLLNIIAWIAMVTMILAVMTRLGIKFIISRRSGWDDLLITAAMVLGIGQTIAVSVQVTNGLGQVISALTEAQIVRFQQAGYAAEMLYIPAVCCAKLSSLAFYVYLTPDKKHLRATRAVQALAIVWTTTAVLATAFQCHLPRPWAITSGHCFDQEAFWIVIGAFDILTDVAIIVLPLYIVHDLQMARSQKAIVVGAFSSRLLVIPATVCRLVYLPQALHTSDPTFDYYSFFLCTQLEMNISIVASCVPYLKPFFESLQGGMLSIEVGRHSPSRTRSHLSKGSYAMDRLSSNGKDASSERAGFGTQRSLRPDADLFRNHTTVTMAVVDRRADGDGDSDTTAGSDKMIIKQTREWRVDYNDKQQESA